MDILKNIQRPLIYTHINPYDRFEVDLDRRVNFKRKAE